MFRLLALLRDSLRALRRRPLRTLLTTLGVVIGVAAVIAMISIGRGAGEQVAGQVRAMGQNLLVVMAGGAQAGGVFAGAGSAGTLSVEDAEAIRREVPGVRYVSAEAGAAAQVAAGGENWNTLVLGQGHEYARLREWGLTEGGFFDARAERRAERVAVLGRTVRQKLFPAGGALGAVIRVNGTPFTVVGVLEAKGGSLMGQDQDDVVLVPYTTALRRLLGQTQLRTINVGAKSPEAVPEVQREIVRLLRQRHRLAEDKDDDFSLHTQQEIAELAGSTTRVMASLLGAIAAVSLLVGGIGIMNIMLVSVTERTREIGLRLALGARRRDVLRQFLLEAALLSAVGGVIGVALGTGAAKLAGLALGWPITVPAAAALGAFLFSGGVGVFFGYYPARQASRLDPIQALRHE